MHAFPTMFFSWLLPWYTDNLRTKCCPLMWTGPEPDWRRKVTGGVISNPPKLIWGSRETNEKKDEKKILKIPFCGEINVCEHKFHSTLTDGMTDGFRMTRGTLVLFPSYVRPSTSTMWNLSSASAPRHTWKTGKQKDHFLTIPQLQGQIFFFLVNLSWYFISVIN